MILKSSSKYYYFIAIFTIAIIIHGLLLLNDGVYWDGWLIYTDLIDKEWNSLYLCFVEVGLPLILYLHWFMGYFPNIIFGYKLAAFMSLTFSAILIFMICNELGRISRLESFFIAVLGLSYPAFQVSIELMMLPYLVCYCLFFCGVFLTMTSEKKRGLPHSSLRLFSLVFFFLSFTIESLLVFYYGFLLIFLMHFQRIKKFNVKKASIKFFQRRIDFITFIILDF